MSLTHTGLAIEPSLPLDKAHLQQAALEYLRAQPHLSQDSRIDIKPIAETLPLSHCEQLRFTSPVYPLQGALKLKVECETPEVWSLWLNVNIQRPIRYFVLRDNLDSSRALQREDLILMEQYTSHAIPGLIDDAERIIGLRLNHALKAGSPVRLHDLGSEPALSRGQTVKLISQGKGFQISTEGRLLRNSFEGQNTQVQLASRQIVNGIAHKGGVVEIFR